jgi:hypothetical protein
MDDAARRQLFDGRSLDGWEHVGPGGFSVEGGCLKSEGGMGLLWYAREKLGNCSLRVVYKTSRDEDNSGVFIRIAEAPPDPWFAVHHGYEVQIWAPADEWHRSGVIYSMTRSEQRPDRPAGEWNTMDIELDGERVRVSLNGVQVTDFESSQDVPPRQRDYEPERGPRPAAGYIGLQNHDDASVVYFREVSVAPLAQA